MIGQTISHYRILRKLGGGGMGIVYEAEDVRLGRHVALKFLPEAMAKDRKALQRFEREAHAASALNHPNICTIFEVEEHDHQPVIVMELLDGKTLKEKICEGHISTDEILEFGTQASEALEAAHAKGIIHRDIKPGNLFIVGGKRVKILDFGLAKVIVNEVPENESDEESLTAEGVIPGTTGYMSPEQVRGEEIDTRSDLFSLGVVLYEMATGQRPFVGKNRVLVMDAILNTRPVAPSHIIGTLPTSLDTIICKLLEKNRKLRYQHAAELSSDLKRLRRETESGIVAAAAPAPIMQTKSRIAGWKLALSFGFVALVIAGIVLVYARRPHALTEKDSIVLADFENKTGDDVFDETLKQALAVDLGQSPFLNIISERKITATLLLMGLTSTQRVTGEIARELCERVGSKAMLEGSISSLGSEYVIDLNAINCASGDILLADQARSSGKSEVLKAIDKSASMLRNRLGESLASVQKFSTPVEEATTPSLEALKAYSIGRKVFFQNGDASAVPYYERAVELDPNFAMAYTALAISYGNLGQTTRASDDANKAFNLRARVSERERYRISAAYYSDVTGELDKARQTYELWRQSYPRDILPPGNLGDLYMRLGQWEKALREAEELGTLEPNSAVYNSNLAQIQLALNRTEEATATLNEALKRKLDAHDLRVSIYEAAFLRNDQKTMEQQLAWAAGRAGEEDWLLSAQSDTEAYFGRLVSAQQFSQLAVSSGTHAGAKEAAAIWEVDEALREAEYGNRDLARRNAMAALALAPGRDVRSLAGLALARAGETMQANKLAEALNKEFPLHTIVQGYWLPCIRAAIEIDAKNPANALQILRSAAPYELSQSQPFQLGMLYPTFLRGQAYLMARQGNEATAEFQSMIDHHGISLNFPLGALASLGLARAYTLQSDNGKAQGAYRDFLTLWKDADPDIPILKEAKMEYAKLQ
jgi:eukaryotic-like serine/threonine-protein kinase